MKKSSYILTGLKVLLLNIVSGAAVMLVNFILGIFGLAGFIALRSASVPMIIFAIFFIIAVFLIGLWLNGFIAQKMFRWR